MSPGPPLTPADERELMRRLRSGDEEAIRVVYARFSRPIYGLGLRLLGSPESAEELTQDVFLAAWRKADSYDPARGRLSTWLMTIGHNMAIDRLRRDRRHAATIPMELEDRPVEGEPEDAGVLDRVTAVRIVGVLGAAERRLLMLAYHRGLTAREIAEADGIPIGTVKTRLRAALIKLRRTEAWKREV